MLLNEDVAMNTFNQTNPQHRSLDLDALLHPAQAFDHPRDVVGDTDLTLGEKRAILASWASDACAVEATPALRCAPGARQMVPVDEILEALRTLDKTVAASAAAPAWTRRQLRRGALERLRMRRKRSEPGSSDRLSQ
jgi:hypothetical protein